MKLEFFRQIFEDYQIPNFMKICPMLAELYARMDGQADIHDEVNSGFSKLWEGSLKLYLF